MGYKNKKQFNSTKSHIEQKPLVEDSADEDQVRNAEIQEKLTREKELNDLKSVLNTRQGRRFVWRLLCDCGIFTLSFTGNSQTFFNEGKRNIGLNLLNEINEASPESYGIMVKESKGEQHV